MKSYSQIGQDLYVMEKLNNKTEGYYIEIGAYDPIHLSNTKLLEENNWNGLSFDIVDISSAWYLSRKNKFICSDATSFDFKTCFIENNVPENVDYISIDIDEATMQFLKQFPFDKYRFKVITLEHDQYRFGKKVRDEMREILTKYNYKLDRPDIGSPSYEDWWLG